MTAVSLDIIYSYFTFTMTNNMEKPMTYHCDEKSKCKAATFKSAGVHLAAEVPAMQWKRGLTSPARLTLLCGGKKMIEKKKKEKNDTLRNGLLNIYITYITKVAPSFSSERSTSFRFKL